MADFGGRPKDSRWLRRRRGLLPRPSAPAPCSRRMARQAVETRLCPYRLLLLRAGGSAGRHLVGDEPGGLAGAYFVSGGSEAIEASIKLARQYFYRKRSAEPGAVSSRAARVITAIRWGALAAGGNAWRRETVCAAAVAAAFRPCHAPAFAYHEMRDERIRGGFCRAARRRTRSRIPSASVPIRCGDSLPSRWWARRPDAHRRRKVPSAPFATSAIATARS